MFLRDQHPVMFVHEFWRRRVRVGCANSVGPSFARERNPARAADRTYRGARFRLPGTGGRACSLRFSTSLCGVRSCLSCSAADRRSSRSSRSSYLAMSSRSCGARLHGPRAGPADRVFLAAASRFLSRKRWSSFYVTPDTLLRSGIASSSRDAGAIRRGDRADLRSAARSTSSSCASREDPRWGYQRIADELAALGLPAEGPRRLAHGPERGGHARRGAP